MPITYGGGPSISLTALGQQQAIGGATPLKTYGLIGTSPIGSDHACIVSFQDALTYFGNPSSVSSSGYTIPLGVTLLASAAQQTNAAAFNLCIMAVGKVAATGTMATGTIFSGTGRYAGTRGTNLSVAWTVVSSAVTAITITDTSTSAVVQSYIAAPSGPDNLSSLQSIADTVNGRNPIDNPNSVVRITTVGSALPTTSGSVALTGSPSNGLGTAASSASIDALLAESLAFDVDYISPLWDMASVQSKLATHAAACASALKFRKFIGGPDSSKTFTTITGSYLSTLSDLYNVWGLPPVRVMDPVLNIPAIKDPFYGAVAAGGLKASGPTQETMDGFPLPGILGFSDWSDHTSVLSPADFISLGSAGLATAERRSAQPGAYIVDNITAAPYSIDGVSVNAFSQFSIRDQDHAVSKTAVRTAKQFAGRPGTASAKTAGDIQRAIDGALADLGFLLSHQTTCTVNTRTLAYQVDIAYIPQYPVLSIPITTHFSFT